MGVFWMQKDGLHGIRGGVCMGIYVGVYCVGLDSCAYNSITLVYGECH